VRREGFPHGKTQHIGRAILAPIPTIETPHPLIAHEHDAQLRRRFPDIGKNRPRQSFQAHLVKRHTSNVTLHMDRHQQVAKKLWWHAGSPMARSE
jgi:hypothetical protein